MGLSPHTHYVQEQLMSQHSLKSNTSNSQHEATNTSVLDSAFQMSQSDRVRRVAEICSTFRDERGTDTNQRINS